MKKRRALLSAGTGKHALNLLLAIVVSLSCTAFFEGCSLTKAAPPEITGPSNLSSELDNAFGEFEFRDRFITILTTLVGSYWDRSGNWKGDLQGDATSFAPMLLYALARDTGELTLRDMADATVSYEAGLVRRCWYWPFPGMDLVIGIPALAQPYLMAGDPSYLPLFFRCVRLGYAGVSLSPGILTPFVKDRASVYGLTAYMCFIAAEASPDNVQRSEFVSKGIALIARADADCWDSLQRLYSYSCLMDWPQQTMMMALVKAYRATGDRAYLDRALTVLDSMDSRFIDAGKGGYYGHTGLKTKGLSGNNNMAWVFLDLYEATGDEMFLEKARRVLQWILSDDMYSGPEGLICHHYAEDSGSAGYFCSGCNFHTLVCIYRYNVLRGKVCHEKKP